MAKIQVRLAEKDRADRERGGEWFEADAQLAELDDLTWDELDTVERETNSSALLLVQLERRALTARYWRVLLWLARRAGGVTEDFAGFKPSVTPHGRGDPDVIAVPAEDPESAGADDADPPEDTPPTSAGSGESQTPSTSSTPRSRASTDSRRGKSAG